MVEKAATRATTRMQGAKQDVKGGGMQGQRDKATIMVSTAKMQKQINRMEEVIPTQEVALDWCGMWR